VKRLPLYAIVLIILLAAIICALPRGSSVAQDRDHLAEGASSVHWAGTDGLGRDRMARTSAALLLCFSLGAAAAGLSTAIAATVALGAAYASPFISSALLMMSDLLLALPGIFLLMVVRASLPLGMSPMHAAMITFLLLALLGWPLMVRTIHAEIRKHRQSEWAFFCAASGLSPNRIFAVHMLAHLRPLLRAHFLLCFPAFLIAEVNLGSLGLGVPEPLASWGSMLTELTSSAFATGTIWRYLPVVVLVSVVVILELMTLKVNRYSSSLLRSANGADCR
jgi:peptide/nickel transport system permease protein